MAGSLPFEELDVLACGAAIVWLEAFLLKLGPPNTVFVAGPKKAWSFGVTCRAGATSFGMA